MVRKNGIPILSWSGGTKNAEATLAERRKKISVFHLCPLLMQKQIFGFADWERLKI